FGARARRVLEHEVLGGEVGGGIARRLLDRLVDVVALGGGRRALGEPGARTFGSALGGCLRLARAAIRPLVDVEVGDQLPELLARDLLTGLLGRDQAAAARAPPLGRRFDVLGRARRRRGVGGDVAQFAHDARAAAAIGRLA